MSDEQLEQALLDIALISHPTTSSVANNMIMSAREALRKFAGVGSFSAYLKQRPDERATKLNEAVMEAQRSLMDEQKPALAQSLNAVLNLPVDSACRLYDILTGEK